MKMSAANFDTIKKVILLIYQYEDPTTEFYLIPKDEISSREVLILTEAHNRDEASIIGVYDRITDEADFCSDDNEYNCKWSKYKTITDNPIAPSEMNVRINFVVFVQELNENSRSISR